MRVSRVIAAALVSASLVPFAALAQSGTPQTTSAAAQPAAAVTSTGTTAGAVAAQVEKKPETKDVKVEHKDMKKAEHKAKDAKSEIIKEGVKK